MKQWNIAFLALPDKKREMVQVVTKYEEVLKLHKLFATKTTGTEILKKTGLEIQLFLSGPYGGDQEVGGKVARGELDMVIFFVDPKTIPFHHYDVNALIRLCNLYHIPLATNLGTAELLFELLSLKTSSSSLAVKSL